MLRTLDIYISCFRSLESVGQPGCGWRRAAGQVVIGGLVGIGVGVGSGVSGRPPDRFIRVFRRIENVILVAKKTALEGKKMPPVELTGGSR